MAFDDPESITDSPAKRTTSSSLRRIRLVPIVYSDEVTYCVDIDTAVNNPVTVKLPEIFTSFVTPSPPAITTAPLLNAVLLVVLFTVCIPAKVLDPVVAIAPIPVVFCTTICDDAVTHPGYCADEVTVPTGKNVLTCALLDTVFAGSSGCTCTLLDTTPLNLFWILL